MFEATSVARFADAIVDIGLSGVWHHYDIDGHQSHWQAAEFDYFLMTCGVKYNDMVEVFKGRANAAALVPLLDQNDPQHRPVRVASEAWGSPWIQAVAATNVDGFDSSRSSSSAGVRQPRRFLGRALSSAATWSSQPGP
jgi:hypothetical protein